VLILAVLTADRRWFIGCGVGILVGLLLPYRSPSDELRLTFLSVGHGGCTVLECPDGRVLLYDAGTLNGSDAVRHSIAPFLWQRGITHIDEVFLSHADLDHFNGVPELLARFAVGQVTLTPSFATKPTAEVAAVLAAVHTAQVPLRIAKAGDRFAAGDVVFDVLHPPRADFGTTENERSMVLKLQHRGHTILLTGDLEKLGTHTLMHLPPTPCDVLMAPHHGSRAALPADLLTWCSPRSVVVSRGARTAGADSGGLPLWDTATCGAITLTSHATGLVMEAFRTGERLVIRRGAVRG
jgi:competence protein ComEC